MAETKKVEMTQNLSLVKQDAKGVVEMTRALSGNKDAKFVFIEEVKSKDKKDAKGNPVVEFLASEAMPLKDTMAEINRRITHMALSKRNIRSYPIGGTETLIEKGVQLCLKVDGVPGTYKFVCPSAREAGKGYNMTPTDHIKKVQDKFQAYLSDVILAATDKKQADALANLQTVK